MNRIKDSGSSSYQIPNLFFDKKTQVEIYGVEPICKVPHQNVVTYLSLNILILEP